MTESWRQIAAFYLPGDFLGPWVWKEVRSTFRAFGGALVAILDVFAQLPEHRSIKITQHV